MLLRQCLQLYHDARGSTSLLHRSLESCGVGALQDPHPGILPFHRERAQERADGSDHCRREGVREAPHQDLRRVLVVINDSLPMNDLRTHQIHDVL